MLKCGMAIGKMRNYHMIFAFTEQILIVWDSGRAIPKVWPDISVPLVIKRSSSKSVSQRFITDVEVETDAV